VDSLLAGLGAFALVFLSDWQRSSLAARPRARAVPASLILSCAALALLALALFLAVARGPRLNPHPAIRVAAGLLSLPPLCLLVISEFIEVGFATAEAGPPRLTESGTYALCRHPGFWWLFLFLLPLSVAAASLSLLAALPAWAAADLALVIAEDRLFFPRIFGPAYLDYRKRVPFLLPDRRSLSRCVATFRFREKGT
jgi:protein-S-isoprenylcysteine O-methyltransferase Ste14